MGPSVIKHLNVDTVVSASNSASEWRSDVELLKARDAPDIWVVVLIDFGEQSTCTVVNEYGIARDGASTIVRRGTPAYCNGVHA